MLDLRYLLRVGGIFSCAFYLTACVTPAPEGTPQEESGSSATGTSTQGDGDGTSGVTTGELGVVEDENGERIDCSQVQRPPTPLRRLTRFEYNNTVRDLLGTELRPADDFPPDEVSEGFSNNALLLTISSLHAEKYTLAAEALAAEAKTKLSTLLPCDPALIGEQVCAAQFADSFGRRAFRRPIEVEDQAVLMEAYALGETFEEGIEVMLRAILQSPHFLHRVELSGSTSSASELVRLGGFETATRLSYLIWSSCPDDALLDAAEAGELETAEQVEVQARRLLADPKAKNAAVEFYRQWLGTNRLDIISKDPEAFPLWSEQTRAAMKLEFDAVLGAIIFGEAPTLQALLTEPLGLPMGALAQLYQLPESTEVTLLMDEQRAGIMTLPGFLSVQAHPDQTSPVLRGKFVREKLLCNHVSPPPDSVSISVPDPVEGGTARERFGRHSEEAFCAECHKLMDPLGYTFESYDAMGAYRTSDQGQTLDLSGEFVQTKELDGPFNDVGEMVSLLASANEVSDCVSSQWFKYAIGRPSEAGDVCSLAPLQNAFSASGSNLLELVVQTTQSEAFLYRRGSATGGTQ